MTEADPDPPSDHHQPPTDKHGALVGTALELKAAGAAGDELSAHQRTHIQ